WAPPIARTLATDKKDAGEEAVEEREGRVSGACRAAAENGPDLRPLLPASAASMASFLCVASVPVERLATDGVPRGRPESHRASIERVSESHTITARSMTFCNSRMFPGQSYD